MTIASTAAMQVLCCQTTVRQFERLSELQDYRQEDRQTEAAPTNQGAFKTLETQHTCKCGQRCSRLLVVVRSTLKIVIKYNPGPNGLENKTLCFNQARAALENKDR